MLIEYYDESNKATIDNELRLLGFNDPGGFMKDVQKRYEKFKLDQPEENLCAEITLIAIADENGRKFKTDSFPDNLYVRQIQDGEITREVMNTVGDGNCGFNAIALGLLDNLTETQLQVCIKQGLLAIDEKLIEKNPFGRLNKEVITGSFLKQEFKSIKEAFHNPQIADKATIIKKQRWLQQVLAGSLRAGAVTAVDALWDQVMPQINARVVAAVDEILAINETPSQGEGPIEVSKVNSDTCKYFGKGMGELVNLSGINESERFLKITEWLTGDGKKYYLETLDTPGFNADNLPMESLIQYVQNQLSQFSDSQTQSSEMEPSRLVSAIASTRDDLSRVDITTTVNNLDIVLTLTEDGVSEESLKDALESDKMKSVVLDFTDLNQPFKLIYKSNEDLVQHQELQPYIEQYKRLRDVVFKDMKPITAVNSGGHWSYVESAKPQSEV